MGNNHSADESKQPDRSNMEATENPRINRLRYGPGKEMTATSTSVAAATGGNMLCAARIDIVAKRLEKEAASVAESIGSRFTNWKPTTKSLAEFISHENWMADDDGILDETPELEYVRQTKSAKYSIKVIALEVDLNMLITGASKNLLDKLDDPEAEQGDDAYGDILTRCIKTDKNGTDWFYDMDTENWSLAKYSDVQVVESSRLAVMQYAEKFGPDGIDPSYAKELEQIANHYDCSTAQELEEILKSNETIVNLRNQTQPYTRLQGIQISDETMTLAILPDDPHRAGFAIYADCGEYVLCQYINTDMVDPNDPSEIPEPLIQEMLAASDAAYNSDAYCREIGRTDRQSVIIRQINELAGQYTRDFYYTVPLSFGANIETRQAAHLSRILKDNETRGCKNALPEHERENLECAAAGFLCILAARRKRDMDREA